jgi:hypothetical protein
MPMLEISTSNLIELAELVASLETEDLYTRKIHSLSRSTIGEHTRHVIELYQCLLNGYESGIINYDERKRSKVLETNVLEAITAINEICRQLDRPDKDLTLFNKLNSDTTGIPTNYQREVYYNLEHCTHHQALIKVALIELSIENVSEQFGVAPSTLQYRKQCAQ